MSWGQPHTPASSKELMGSLGEQIRLEVYIVRSNLLNAELFKDFFSIHEGHHLKGALTTQIFSFIGIDVVHHELDMLLVINGKVSSLRYHSPY